MGVTRFDRIRVAEGRRPWLVEARLKIGQNTKANSPLAWATA